MIYKHIVPTGLRALLDWICLLKLTLMVRNPYQCRIPNAYSAIGVNLGDFQDHMAVAQSRMNVLQTDKIIF